MKVNKSEFINGKYYTKNEAADLIGISYGAYVARLSTLNKTPQEAFDMGENGNKNPKTELINGKYYTKNEAANLIGISYGTYVARISNKTSQEAFDMGKGKDKNPKSQLINGKYYTSKEAADLIGISLDAYKGRIYKIGFTAQEAFNMRKDGNKDKAPKTEFINGKYYTKKEAAKLIGINRSTYRRRLKAGKTPQEAFDMGKVKYKNTKSQLINGKYYTKKEAAKLIGINRETYRRRLKAGKTPQEAFDMGKTKPGKRSSKSHFINGKYYTSKEAADFIGISLDAYKSRLKRGASPQEIFDKIKGK